MNSLLSINNDMNVFSLNTHSGDRPLYSNLVALGEKFPWVVDSIKDYPLFTMAIERNEEMQYNMFVSQLENLFVKRDDVKRGPRLG